MVSSAKRCRKANVHTVKSPRDTVPTNFVTVIGHAILIVISATLRLEPGAYLCGRCHAQAADCEVPATIISKTDADLETLSLDNSLSGRLDRGCRQTEQDCSGRR